MSCLSKIIDKISSSESLELKDKISLVYFVMTDSQRESMKAICPQLVSLLNDFVAGDAAKDDTKYCEILSEISRVCNGSFDILT